MEYPVPAYTTFVIPTGATTGARIVIDGTTGKILVYNSSNVLVDEIGGQFGDIISHATGLTTDVALSEGQVTFGTFTGAASVYGDLIFGGGLFLGSGIETGNANRADAVEVIFRAGADSVPSGNANVPHVVIGDGNLTSSVDTWITGAMVKAKVSDQSVYTWQAPSLNSGWAQNGTSGGPFQACQFRKDAEDNLVIVGLVHTTSATPNATIFQLPSSDYYPKANQRVGVVVNTGGTLSANICRVSNTGAVSLLNNPTAASVDVHLYVTVPLGNIA